jgi:hypothetical protein
LYPCFQQPRVENLVGDRDPDIFLHMDESLRLHLSLSGTKAT